MVQAHATAEQARETDLFWKNWNKKVIRGGEQVDSEEEKNEVATKLGLHQRSITPTTLDQVDLSGEDDTYYKEIYRYEDNTVTRFGINTNTKIEREPSPEGWVSGAKSAQTETMKVNAAMVKLHEIENDLLRKAIHHFKSTDDKVVVIDILERNNGVPAFKNDGSLKVHSVVLFRNKAVIKESEEAKEQDKEKILVIDPSNFQFSCHLANFNDERFKLYTKYNAIKIYTPNGKTGVNYNDYRDCIDVAVKLAFGFNMNKSETSLDNITNTDVVKYISNQAKIDTSIMHKDITPSRTKQSSNFEQVKTFNKIEQKFDEAVKTTKPCYPIFSQRIKDKHKQYIDEDKEHQEVIDGLIRFHSEYVDDMKALLDQSHVDITGEHN